MLKKASLQKQAGVMKKFFDYITPNIVKDFGGRHIKGFITGTRWSPKLGEAVTQNFSLPGVWNVVKKHPLATATLTLPATTYMGYKAGGIGNSDLQAALDRANATSTKLVAENKKLKAGSGSFWGDILKAFSDFIARWFPKTQNKQNTNIQPKVKNNE